MKHTQIRVERGVPVKFSIEAGYDVSFYITSDFFGENASLKNQDDLRRRARNSWSVVKSVGARLGS